ncbi:Sodium leak channel non-selective protein [Aphelenchoides bicaudatus]|nr:Sodium leak channel non-selective protein [Aphelenchoides bicaudatus]
MLTRRKSSCTGSTHNVDAANNGPTTTLPSATSRVQAARESMAILADLLTLEPSRNKESVIHMRAFEAALKLACVLSMVSVCMHTPQTIALIPGLNYAILVVDIVVTLFFTFEALLKRGRGLLGDRWNQFDMALLILHYLTIGLHFFEIFATKLLAFGLVYKPWYGVLRSPRPLILIRLLRQILHIQLPKNRIKQIMKRSSQQIQNVTIFFLFFLTLYSIMGVQLFGSFEYHCVLKGTDPNNVTINDLSIPDSMCSIDGSGYECPKNMECARLNLNARQSGFYGMFDDFGASLFTVYLAASQEGWVYVLYDTLDSFSSYMCFIYFISLIEMWQNKEVSNEESYHRLKLQNTDEGWKLSEVDSDVELSRAPQILTKIVRSTTFQIIMMFLVLVNALINASFIHYHDESDRKRKRIYYYIEIGFTLLFNLECVLKIVALSWAGYFRRGQHKFELILCIGSSLNVMPIIYGMNIFTYFQVFRIIRLIKASPMLEDFLYKIFGPGKKLGGLVVFTMILLIIASAVSLQLFCFVTNLDKFQTFPQAFMTMFQIMTQEGWTEVAVEILRAVNEPVVPFVAAYFVGYHLFVTLIVLSLFVAVILDNLEMDEELKKIKQLKAREETTLRTSLPWRLQVFNRFPARPQMVTLRKISSEFPMPKVRDSFTRQFSELNTTDSFLADDKNSTFVTKKLLPGQPFLRQDLYDIRVRQIGQLTSKTSIACLIEESNKNRMLLSDSTQFITQRSGGPRRRDHTMRHRQRGLNGGGNSLKSKTIYEHLKENGDVRLSDSAQKDTMKQGEIDIKALQQKRAQAEFTRNRIEGEIRENHSLFDRPLFVIGRNSHLRQICQNIVYAKYSVEKIDPVSGKPIQLKYKQIHALLSPCYILRLGHDLLYCPFLLLNVTRKSVAFNRREFSLQQLLFKILANGLFFTPNAVVHDVGGVMTLFIYITSVCYLMWLPKHVEINSLAQLLMIFRAMRPLRIYTLVPHIRRANCTGYFEQKLFITRMEVFGKNDDRLHPKMFVPRVWTNPRNFNFDHIGNAMLALFETLSYKGWNVIRDILWIRQGPWAVLFIHIYVFLGSMIGITLFVGVVVANYMQNRGTALLTVDQRRWHDLKARLRMAQPLHVPPKPSESARFRSRFYELTTSRPFKRFFLFLVLINSATLILPWNIDEEQMRSSTLFYSTFVSGVCNMLFALEIVLKMIAFTFWGFWQSRRNRIDLLITVLGIAWIFGHFIVALPASVVGGQAKLKRFTYTFGFVVVMLRFFTIAGRKSTLKMLMLTVLMSMLRSLFIIIAMFLMVLFYAYAGVILFGMVKYGQAVSKHVNFRTSKEALVVLFRSVTGEDWNDIMHDCMRSAPFCYWREGINYWESDCGNKFGAVVYFCSFYLIITYIVLNLLVAIIMENFSLFYSSEEDALLSYADIRNYQQVWNMVDIEQKRSIPVRRVKFLLRLLRGRLEVDPNKDRLLFKHMCYEMERLHNGEDVSFHDILNMLSYRSVDIRKSLQLEELLQREELEYIIEEQVAKYTIRSWLEQCLRRIKAEEKQQTDLSLIAQIRSSMGQPPRPSITELEQLSRAEEDTRVETPDELKAKARAAKGRRRSSIPDLMNEAKKLVWGNRNAKGASATDRPNVVPANSETGAERRKSFRKAQAERAANTNKPRIERRSTLKQLKLPDVEEIGELSEENMVSPTDRRHSLEASTLTRNDSTTQSRRPSRQLNSVAEAALSNVVMEVMHQKPQQPDMDIHNFDINRWWSELAAQ